MPNSRQICPRCVMDTSAPNIEIFEDGCNYCKEYDDRISELPFQQANNEEVLAELLNRIRSRGKGKKYDCVIGLSGGVDSTYLAWLVKNKYNLNPIAVHMDNGWNDELAVHNIEKTVRKLDLDLVTEVLTWKEFSSIQKAFLKASVADCEIPTDHAIYATLYKVARRFNVPTIIVGSNLVTERIMPLEWSRGHRDWKYISGIINKFSAVKPKSYPHTPFLRYLWNTRYSAVDRVPILSYINFDKTKAESLIKSELSWVAYGAKHYESLYTKFFQGYWLPTKFGYDKRRAHCSNLICAKQLTREQALKLLSEPAIGDAECEDLIEYVTEKFELSKDELLKWHAKKNMSFTDYPSTYNCTTYFIARAIYRYTLKPMLSAFGKI